MKQKLTITIDEKLIPQAKRHARKQGVSLSELIERRLTVVCKDGGDDTFSSRWRGKVRLKPRSQRDMRFGKLAKKHL